MFLNIFDVINQYQLFLILAPISAAFCLVATIFAWNQRSTPGASRLAFALFLIFGWLVFNCFEMLAIDEEVAIFFAKIQYFFIMGLSALWFIFSSEFSEFKQIKLSKKYWLLLIVPIITIVLVFTNESHHLIWISACKDTGQLLPVSVNHGAFFYIEAVYNYLLVLIGSLRIFFRQIRKFRYNKPQTYWIVFGVIQVILFNMVYVFGLIPGLKKDYTPISFALTGLCFLIGITFYRMFSPIPIARNQLIDFLGDALVLFDLDGNILDVNPEFVRLAGIPSDKIINIMTYLDFSLFDDIPIMVINDHWQKEILVNMGNNFIWFDVHFYPIRMEQNQLIGKVVTFRNIQNRIITEKALNESEVRYRQLFENCPLPLNVYEMVLDENEKIVDWIVRDTNLPELFPGVSAKEEILGKSLSEVADIKDLSSYYAASQKVFESGENQQIEGTILSKDHYYLTSVFYFGRSSQGKLLCATASVDITQRRRLQEITEKLANTDHLTGVFNRRYFNEKAEAELDRSCSLKKPISFIMLDLDGFKKINDSFGHPVGDQVLKFAVKRISQSVRAEDLIARYGGDEFILMLPETGKKVARTIANRICSSVDNVFFDLKGENIPISFSIGVLGYDQVTYDIKFNSVLRKVDKALYNSKHLGKGRVSMV